MSYRNRKLTARSQAAEVEEDEVNGQAADIMDELEALAGKKMGRPGATNQSSALGIVRRDKDTLEYHGALLSPVGVIFPKGMKQEVWAEVGDLLTRAERSVSWWVGDWANYAHDTWGMGYEVIAAQFNYEIPTLYTYAWLAGQYEISIRNRDLSFAHHRLVAKLDNRTEWLAFAVEHKMTVKQLREALKKKGDDPDDSDELKPFTRAYTSFSKKQLEFAKNLQPYQRQQMADMLRDLANKIEQG